MTPPNDSPFDDNEPAPAPEPKAPAAPAPPADLTAAVTKALEPYAKQIAQQGQHLDQLARVVAQQVQDRGETHTPAPPAEGGSFLDQFVEKPEDTLKEFVTKAIQDTMTPYMGVLMADQQHDAFELEKQAFERTYGDGQWSELVEPRLKVVLDNMQEPHRASRLHIQQAVAGIKGSMEDQLFELRQKRAKEMADKARSEPPRFVGPGRPGPRRSEQELDPESKDFLARLGRTLGPGKTLDEDTVKRLRSVPKTPEAYARFHEQQRKKANGAGE